MSFFVILQLRAICLLFTTVYAPVTSDSHSYFTTTPKDREVFVGTDVQLNWDFALPSSPGGRQVEKIRFGVILKEADNRNQPKEITIVYITPKDGKKVWNDVDISIEWIKNRIVTVKDRRASFKIKQVQLEDTGKYFCSLDFGRGERSVTDVVSLSVVDLLIDKKSSTEKAVSWRGNKLRVVCGVKVAPEGIDAKFSWMHLPSNSTVERKNHDDSAKSSYLTMVTYEDKDFEQLQCRAATKATVKYHEINITRLFPPGPPYNLKAERIFTEARIVIRLHWEAPSKSGGTVIEKYHVAYKPKGLQWKDATIAETPATEFDKLKLRNGVTYNVIVKAENKAGVGSASNEVDVKIGDIDDPGLYKSNGARNRGHVFRLLYLDLLLVCLVALWL